ncbi:MAG TPA: family 16 glycoside hydrolase [Acidobacteriaceae bacterium]|jgi:hypothetical protein|nr:family 16 glycoside hydrolase [Acidobacteriaceae bacterium]
MANLRRYGLPALAVLLLAGIALYRLLAVHAGGDPLQHKGWKPISGNWTLHDNVISNAHYGRGDMLIMEHPEGSDSRISADVRFDLLFEETHYGDAGLILRATDPQPGVDSYKGYYAGLRPDNQTLVLGRASYDWHLLQETRLAAPMAAGAWYHLELTAHGCNLEVDARPVDEPQTTTIRYTDSHCLTAGAGGLRSFYADASWRNVRVDRY